MQISKDKNLQKFRLGHKNGGFMGNTKVHFSRTWKPVFVWQKHDRIGWKRDALVWDLRAIKKMLVGLVGTSCLFLDDSFVIGR